MTLFTTPLKLSTLALILFFAGCSNKSTPTGTEKGLLPTTFPADFTPPNDFVTGLPLDGWGGGDGEITHTPIVFVHGNAHSAENWVTMATYFANDGYTWNELWAVSYLQFIDSEDYNSNNGNWSEIGNFVQDVLDYTGQSKVDIIAHSLGVTVARTWLRHTGDYDKVAHFIGIAGANHGVAFCGPNDHRGMCNELGNPDSDFLHWLNDDDETPSDSTVQWITVYNGANLDIFFPENALMNDSSTVDLRLSPVLNGAINIQFPTIDHIHLALSRTVYDTLKQIAFPN